MAEQLDPKQAFVIRQAPEELAREFKPRAQSIRNWLAQRR